MAALLGSLTYVNKVRILRKMLLKKVLEDNLPTMVLAEHSFSKETNQNTGILL